MSDDTTALDGDLMDDVTSAFLGNLNGEEPKKEPAETPAEEPKDEPEATEVEPEAPAEADPDDAEVELKVGETATKAKLRDLKAAFAAKAETDRVAQETAALRQKAELEHARASAALGKAVEKARARYEPYSKIDFLALSRDPSIDQETFQAIRKEAQEALEEYKFFSQELDSTVQAQQAQARERTTAAASAAVAELSDPVKGIPGWNKDLYESLLGFAVKAGAPQASAAALTDPWAFRVLHKAYLYEQGAKAAAEKVEKVVHKPSRVLKPTGSGAGSTEAGLSRRDAMNALRKVGSVDAAADAFLATFRD